MSSTLSLHAVGVGNVGCRPVVPVCGVHHLLPQFSRAIDFPLLCPRALRSWILLPKRSPPCLPHPPRPAAGSLTLKSSSLRLPGGICSCPSPLAQPSSCPCSLSFPLLPEWFVQLSPLIAVPLLRTLLWLLSATFDLLI